MSATIARPLPGWARASLYVGLPLCALAGGCYWTWSARSHAPVVAAKTASWGSGTVLPTPPIAVPVVATVPAPVVPKVAPPAAPVVAPPVHVLTVWQDKSAIDEVRSGSAERHTARQRPDSGTDGRSGAGSGELVPGGPPAASSEYAQRMQATEFGTTTPVPPRMPPAYTVKKGYRVPCLPDQPLSSEMVGPIKCITTQDVWSMDGNNRLLPIGTEINGTIERGLSGGGRRLFPIWTDMLTPRPFQLAIPLNAPSADEMGQSGLPGDIDTHLGLKARDLALVSVIQMGGSVATAAAQSGNGNTTLNLGAPVNASQSLAERAFGGELGIPDTFYRGPGQPILIVTNHYINLEHYYRNRVIR